MVELDAEVMVAVVKLDDSSLMEFDLLVTVETVSFTTYNPLMEASIPSISTARGAGPDSSVIFSRLMDW